MAVDGVGEEETLAADLKVYGTSQSALIAFNTYIPYVYTRPDFEISDCCWKTNTHKHQTVCVVVC